ncbi:hypothetical protein B5M09_009595 [Aphanomyces astaci]|uniref:Uncharacterized protein n=1 Tax=Aphanomyces astaci TaxID=112090 RepID=A0A3R7W1D3_APHAT|nr:hypothetical protein B5M09_009595 [Aphanomyces astaci]
MHTFLSKPYLISILCSGGWIDKLHVTFGRHADDPFAYCAVCQEPLTHLDHGFFCSHAQRPHVQHWTCQANPPVQPSASSRKKKARASKASPLWTAEGRALLPPSTQAWPQAVSLLCGVCHLPMDHRAVAVSKSTRFSIQPYVQATTAVYSHQGQFVNDERPPPVVVGSGGTSSGATSSKPTPANVLPSSDRFRVERGLKLVQEVQALLEKAKSVDTNGGDNADMCAHLSTLIDWIKPLDAYAGDKLSQVLTMLVSKRGPGVAVLKQLVRDYTKLLYAKHVKAVEKAAADLKKREMESAVESKRVARERIESEAERTLKAQLQAAKKRDRARERKRQKMASSTIIPTPPPPSVAAPAKR